MPVYAVPIQPIRVQPPNYDFKELGQGFDAIRNFRTGRAVGERLTGNDLRGASVAAFSGGDMRTGVQLQDLERRQASDNARLGMERQRLDLLTRERDREEQQRQVTILGNLAEIVRGIQDPEQRKAAWDRLVAGTPRMAELLTQYGQDPADHTRGPDFIIAQTRDPLARRATEAGIEATRARGAAREMDAETRRLRTLYDQFTERLGENPTEEAWARESQPGGIIHALFPGQTIPYSERQGIIRQVQDRRRAIVPSEDDLAELGLNPAQMTVVRRRAALRRLFGSPGPGYNWEIDESGAVRRIQEGREDARNPISTEQIQFNIEQLRDVFTLLAGTTNAQGRLNTSGSYNPITRGIAAATGGWVFPGAAEAQRAAEHAALNLSYALSGRQIGQAEQGRILEMFVPKLTDGREISAFKLNAAINLFNRLLEARGRPAAERATIFDSELVRQARELRNRRAREEGRSGRETGPEASRPGERDAPADDGFRIRRLD